jgi:hypothetical protein
MSGDWHQTTEHLKLPVARVIDELLFGVNAVQPTGVRESREL